jgi:UDP-N-acetylglucosamine 2-epimerase (non-hydrolysing)
MLKKYNFRTGNIIITKPIGYIDFQNLMLNSKFVMTDSGGIQEEATVKNIPCLTLRTTTERPITIAQGSNLLAGSNKNIILKAVDKIVAGRWKRAKRPPLWDGRTAARITDIILKKEKYICSS